MQDVAVTNSPLQFYINWMVVPQRALPVATEARLARRLARALALRARINERNSQVDRPTSGRFFGNQSQLGRYIERTVTLASRMARLCRYRVCRHRSRSRRVARPTDSDVPSAPVCLVVLAALLDVGKHFVGFAGRFKPFDRV
jgi:hypothetical protein